MFNVPAKVEASEVVDTNDIPVKEGNGESLPQPTLEEFLSRTIDESNGPVYSEDSPPDPFDNVNMIQPQMQSLYQDSPRTRAEKGAMLGGLTGMALNGINGVVIGSAVGAVAGRAAGTIQSGEHQLNKYRELLGQSLGYMGVIGESNKIAFEDGEVSIPLDPSFRLSNNSPYGVSEKDRSVYEVDPTHPLTNRTSSIAKPLAYFISSSLINQTGPKNGVDAKAFESTTGFLTNVLQSGASDMRTVYRRGSELVSKMGLDEDRLRSFFDTVKNKFSAEEALEIRDGLDKIFGA